jgi:hypothetical protein
LKTEDGHTALAERELIRVSDVVPGELDLLGDMGIDAEASIRCTNVVLTRGLARADLVFETEADEDSEPGEYEVSAAGLTSNNYDIIFFSGTLTVLEVLPRHMSQQVYELQRQVLEEVLQVIGVLGGHSSQPVLLPVARCGRHVARLRRCLRGPLLGSGVCSHRPVLQCRAHDVRRGCSKHVAS